MILNTVGFPFFIFLVFLDTSVVDGMLMDDHGSPDFKRMVSVVTQQSEVTNEQDTAGQEQAPENKIIEDETMELGRVRFFQNHSHVLFQNKSRCLHDHYHEKAMNLQGRRPETLIAFECLSTMIDHAEGIFETKSLLKPKEINCGNCMGMFYGSQWGLYLFR